MATATRIRINCEEAIRSKSLSVDFDMSFDESHNLKQLSFGINNFQTFYIVLLQLKAFSFMFHESKVRCY